MNNNPPQPPPYGGKYDCADPNPSWTPEQRERWLLRQLEINRRNVVGQVTNIASYLLSNIDSTQAQSQQPQQSRRVSQPNRQRNRRNVPAYAPQSSVSETTTQQARKAGRRSKRGPWDPDAPCCECGSFEHQLANHPNPSTPEGYLRGCLPCNTKDHSHNQCPNRKKTGIFHYYRKQRDGLCPAEWHGDMREIPTKKGEYQLELMPLTPSFALRNLYEDVLNFKHPGRGGNVELKSDPFWESDQAWSNVGCFSNPLARVDAEELEKWKSESSSRYAEMRSVLAKMYNERQESAPTAAQLSNFSSMILPLAAASTPRPRTMDGEAHPSIQRAGQNQQDQDLRRQGTERRYPSSMSPQLAYPPASNASLNPQHITPRDRDTRDQCELSRNLARGSY
ncbi:uncharacterized protein LY89DRAFT_670096 [Mollisia scopiformis]|uniref:Uncharacterized protein n=1 Tax=Mollisia scopiformis TaxID=149040 RepID=A0A194X8V8_MOLSC|nr:uncharacterized protein LY89DRAFT_670096 [Mollisia scopiformis]KUJ16606.1 hypothetical protein LY89DRAFT_670096 [Mollisia scopiformis]